MIKKLMVVGNSLALVIDKPTRRFLNIGRKTQVRVTTQDRRLIIEPIPETPPPPPSERDVVPVFNMLVDRYGMTQERFTRLHHRGMRMFGYHACLRTGLASTTDDQERATFRRLHACLTALQRRESWDDAITAALHAEPKPETPAPTPAPTAVPAAAEVADDQPSEGVEVSWGLRRT
jgi:hypothetical protein